MFVQNDKTPLYTAFLCLWFHSLLTHLYTNASTKGTVTGGGGTLEIQLKGWSEARGKHS